jgi:putative ABC transport system permease protein
MIAPRWRKVLRDIAETPLRSALAVFAMAVGVFGAGAILTSYAILTRELATTYRVTRPSSATLVLEGAVSDALVESTRRIPGVGEVEARPVIRGRLRVAPDEWVPVVLFVVRDFRDLRLDRFKRDAGEWPPGDGEVLLERASLSVARAAIGDKVEVRTLDGKDRPLRVAGTVHAAGLAPGWMDHVVSGFVGWCSVVRADTRAEAAELRIVVGESPLDAAHIREVANRVKDSLETQGHRVLRIDLPAPGRHPHADQMDTFLFLLGAFGALTLVLGAVLVANMIHALLTEQVRQIGVMKTIGASTAQVAALYLGQVSVLATLSLCLGLPLGLSAGRAYARFCAGILNADIANAFPPLWVVLAEVAVGILVPFLVALGPVSRASRITIRCALSNDAGRGPFGSRRFDRWLARIQWLPRPLMLSLRTTFDRRGRLLLTTGTLAAGGAAFISALNVSAAWTRALDADAGARHYDLAVRLSAPTPVADVARALADLPEVARAEYWREASVVLIAGQGAGEPRVSLIAPDAGSKLLDLPLLAGRWLAPDDEDVAVINQAVLARDPSLHSDGSIRLRVNGRVVTWRVIGVVKELGPFPAVYAPARSVLAATGQSTAITRGARVVTRRHDLASQVSASRSVERALARAGIGVLGVQALSDVRKAFADHLVIIKSALFFAAMLVVLVGGLGLVSTLTLNVIERTREIGVLSAIGAGPRTIVRHVVLEAIVIGLLSWCLAIVIAVPVTLVLDAVNGQIFINSPLEFFMSPLAVASWLLLVLVLASLSSFAPARRASRLAVRDALAYE